MTWTPKKKTTMMVMIKMPDKGNPRRKVQPNIKIKRNKSQKKWMKNLKKRLKKSKTNRKMIKSQTLK